LDALPAPAAEGAGGAAAEAAAGDYANLSEGKEEKGEGGPETWMWDSRAKQNLFAVILSIILMIITSQISFFPRLQDFLFPGLATVLFISATIFLVRSLAIPVIVMGWNKITATPQGMIFFLAPFILIVIPLIILIITWPLTVVCGAVPSSTFLMGPTCDAVTTSWDFGFDYIKFGGDDPNVWKQINQFFINLLDFVIPDRIFGVELINPLSYQSCAPFCISETGQNVRWRGLEITRLDVFPETIYDHQRFNIRLEITNNGGAPATFTPAQAPLLGTSEVCRWSFLPGGNYQLLSYEQLSSENVEISYDKWQLCVTKSPLEKKSKVDPYIGGACLDQIDQNRNGKIDKIFDEDGNEKVEFDEGDCIDGSSDSDCDTFGPPSDKCTLEPGESLKMIWYGFGVKADIVFQGDVDNPPIIADFEYNFTPQNDLIGQLVVLSQQTQLTALEETSLGRINNKISQSYSPVGPVQMALGTAEAEVVEGVPSLFIIQFANQGRGIVKEIKNDSILVFIPKVFKPLRDDLCDLDRVVDARCGLDPITGETGCTFSNLADDKSYDADQDSPFAAGDWSIYNSEKDIGELIQSDDPFENPILGCLLDTSGLAEGRDLSTYTVKARIKQYTYQETRESSLKIVGTGLPEEVIPD